MDEEPDLDEEDIDSVCLLEEVEEPSQRRRLLRGLTIIEFNESQIVDFLRIAGKKLASNDPEKALAGALILSALCHNLWTRLTITMYSRVLVKQILEWIPKVRIQNWKAAMNRPVADALYHLSRFAPYMQGSTAHHIITECQRMLYAQNLTVCGQTLILEIFLRFGIPYIFELDISKLHAIIGLGPEFHFFISARNSRVPLRCHVEPRARRAYLDFGNTWFLFLSIYYYRALNVIDMQHNHRKANVIGAKRKHQNDYSTSPALDVEEVLCENRREKSPTRLYCIPNTSRLVDFDFLQSICQSEQFPPLCVPLERLRVAWHDLRVQRAPGKGTCTGIAETVPSKNKCDRTVTKSQLNNVVRQLCSGASVDLDALFGTPLYATIPNDGQKAPETTTEHTSKDLDSITTRREQATEWTNCLFRATDDLLRKPKVKDLFDIEDDDFRIEVENFYSCLPYERRYLEILKIYGSKTINWQRKKCSNRLMESVICLSECAL